MPKTVMKKRTARRRRTKRRGGAGAGASASRRFSASHCDWVVTSSRVDRENEDVEVFGDNHPHPTVHFNDIVGKNGQIKNNELKHTLRRTSNQHDMDMTVQYSIPRVTHVQRLGQMLGFYHDGASVGYVIVQPIGRLPAWMVRHSPNPKRSPNGTKFPKWMTTSQSFSPAEPEDDNHLPTVDLGEIVGKNGEIVQTSLLHMLSHTCSGRSTERVPVEGITNVTHVRRYNRLLSFYNDDIYLGNIVVQAMGNKQPSWMIMS